MIRSLTLFLGGLMLSLLPLSAGSLLRQKVEINPYQLREGDIVFQGNAGPQSDAIRAATGSRYTHCGIVFDKDGSLMVIEAIQPVQVTPLEKFVARSLPGTFHARRLTKPLDPASVAKARNWATKQLGLPYDLRFAWGDKELYCSEFVWKLYHEAGIELCETRPFKSYSLNEPSVKTIIDQRYGGLKNLPLEEPAVAPGDLTHSPLLVEVPKAAAPKKR